VQPLLAISLGRDQDARANFMNKRYIKWYTPYLSRDFEMLVFGEKSGLPLILFPTSGARYYENKDFGLVGSVAWYIDNGKITVYCPEAIGPFRIPAKHDRPVEIQSYGYHPRHRRMGQDPPRILSLVRNFEFKGHQALARRWKMARA
jgi:hypothetical protein